MTFLWSADTVLTWLMMTPTSSSPERRRMGIGCDTALSRFASNRDGVESLYLLEGLEGGAK
jgi:hypothetical protein